MIEDDQLKKLKDLRTREDLKLRPSKFLRSTIVGLDGTEKPFTPRYYQVQGILHLLAMPRFLLGDDVGIGKTPQAIVTMCFLWEKDPNLKCIVLTNKSASAQWCSEFDKFTVGIKSILCKGTPAQRKKARQEFMDSTGPTALVMGYRSAVGDFEDIQDWEGYVLITDEAQAYKNHETQAHKVVKYMGSRASRMIALTATMIKNELLEGWGIYSALVPGLFGSKSDFMDNYCIVRMQQIPKSRRQIPVVVGYRKGAIEAFKTMIDPYYLGRAKHDVAKELPPLTSTTVKTGMSKAQREKYDEALTGLLEIGTKTGDVLEKNVTVLTKVAYCQLIADHPGLIDCDGESEKLDVLIDMLTDGELSGKKVIVYTRFKKMVYDYMLPALKAAKIKAVEITGDCDEKKRKAHQDAFQNPKGDTRVICITSAASEAINLQAAEALVFYDTPWSAGEYLQIIGRMSRIGSVHDRIFAIHLVAEGTIDERVQNIIKKKMGLIDAVLGKRLKGEGDDVTVSAENDISELFKDLLRDAQAVKK